MSRSLELIIGIVSLAMFVGTIAAIPWVVRRLPVDYFVKPRPEHPLPLKVVRNVAGGTLVAAGIAMLVLPGQGILTILIGLSIMDLPVKHRIVRRLLQRPQIQRGVQSLRRRAGQPPLLMPPATDAPAVTSEDVRERTSPSRAGSGEPSPARADRRGTP